MWKLDYEFQIEKNERIAQMKDELLHDLQKGNSADIFFTHFKNFYTSALNSKFETMQDVIRQEFEKLITEIYCLD